MTSGLLSSVDVCIYMNRINLGGMQTVRYMQHLLQLKYPDLQTHVTLSRAKEIYKHHCYLATHYGEELDKWATPSGNSALDYRVIQLPFNQVHA